MQRENKIDFGDVPEEYWEKRRQETSMAVSDVNLGNNMQRENKWQERFYETFKPTDEFRFEETRAKLKSFIQSEINTAIAEERERLGVGRENDYLNN